jgi:PAS domain S-box-containing protein
MESSRIRSILEALPQMAFTTDDDGNTTYFTKGWYAYTGQSQKESLGLGWFSVVHEEDKSKLVAQWRNSTSTGKTFQQAARYRNYNNEYRWHLARASSIRNAGGEISMWVGTCTDIHDQVLLTEELERKVAERTKSLQVSNNELEQFAHVSSHDLQEPLRKIRTFAELVKDNAYDRLDAVSQKYLDKINATAERMSNSLKALLNFTQLHREEKDVEVDLAEIVSQVLIDLELIISQKRAVIMVEGLPVIKGIPIQMQQLFYNLLNNALKFTRPGTIPEIHISARLLVHEEILQLPQLNRYKEYFQVTVTDNGVGFDQQYAEQIFTIFQRLHSKSEFEGTGIGLSLVKKVIQNHHGQITATSQEGAGARFDFWLPA